MNLNQGMSTEYDSYIIFLQAMRGIKTHPLCSPDDKKVHYQSKGPLLLLQERPQMIKGSTGRYRDGLVTLQDILYGIQVHESLTKTQMASAAKISWEMVDAYLVKLLSKRFIELATRQETGRSTYGQAYCLTLRGKQVLLFLQEWNA